jgi:hypothetical protein
VPTSPADSTDHLRLGRYVIVEQPPLSESGQWTLTSVVCDGVAFPLRSERGVRDPGADAPSRALRVHGHVLVNPDATDAPEAGAGPAHATRSADSGP